MMTPAGMFLGLQTRLSMKTPSAVFTTMPGDGCGRWPVLKRASRYGEEAN